MRVRSVKRKIKCIVLFVVAIMLILGCIKVILLQNEKGRLFNPIYEDDAAEICNSHMVDFYLISCALYFDFDSENLISGSNEIEEKTISYFSKYKDYVFVQEMGKYVDVANKSYDFNVLVPLSVYCFWEEGNVPDQLLTSNVFQTREDFDLFWKDINRFYQETQAKKFFEEQDIYIESFKDKLETDFGQEGLKPYIDEMEMYLGDTEQYNQGKEIDYGILVSLYKVDGASFYTVYRENATIYLCFSGIFEDNKDITSTNIDRIIENAVHEYLHCYINPLVEEKANLVKTLYSNEKKSDFAGEVYQNMDWNRVIDENIVRAVSTRIIARVTGNEKKAYEDIMRREIEFGGFSKVQNIYDILKNYEDNRKEYESIDCYTEQMIEALLQ